MSAQRLDGRSLAKAMRQEVAEAVAARKSLRPPGLAAILLGDDTASHIYVRNKRKACDDAGIHNRLYHLHASTTQAELLSLIEKLNQDPEIHGILVQLPLPKSIDESAIIRAVDPVKDVDCFHPENVGLLLAGHPRFYPCTPHGIVQLLLRNGVDLAGREVVVVGRSNIVGKPLAVMLMQKKTASNPMGGDAIVTVAHSRAKDLGSLCRRAEVLIVAAGVPRLVTADMIRPGAVVIDVGTNWVDGQLVGDVAVEAAEVAGAISPVPGGVGPMTITMLLVNTLQAAKIQQGA